MEVTYINTLDGRTKIEWWEKEDFRGRVSSIQSLSRDLQPVGPPYVIPIPDDTIVCDFCNVKIEESPIPVVWGTHALCKGCFEEIKKEGGDEGGYCL